MFNQSSEDREASPRKVTFRCCDLAVKECDWQTSGNTEHEVLCRVESHFREKHNFSFDVATQAMVRQAIRKPKT